VTTKEEGLARLSFPPELARKLRESPCDVVVTGGGGWIGRAALEMLDGALGDDLLARVFVFGSRDRDLRLRSGRALPCRELIHIEAIGSRPAYFVHCAFLTKDRLADQSVESFIASNRAIGDLVAAAIEKSDARGLFMPSSGAVYKKGTHDLDNDAQANAYGVMKIADEKRFSALAAAKKTPLCLPRLFNLSGPFINKHDLYALASMIGDALTGGPIRIRAAHRVVRSYIHVADLATLGFSMLLDPQPGDRPVFDTAGGEALEIGDLAALVLKALGRAGQATLRPPLVEGNEDVYVGDGRAMRAMMRARGLPLRGMEQQIRDTAEYMQEFGKSAASLGYSPHVPS
jgi:UDP-glucuronate decarboxylase